MPLHIIDGLPGSGKTLYAINHLVKHFFKDLGGILTPSSPFRLVSNIDELKLDHERLEDEIKACPGGIKEYFTRAYQEALFLVHGPIVYILDEAQFIFDRKFYDNDVFGWFQYHRHFGQTIYLISQNALNLPKEIQYCCEYIIRALPRSKSFVDKYFRYIFISSDKEKIGSDKVIASNAQSDESDHRFRPR
jgi:zona occludens toxin (predicted ATPase)